MKDFVKSNDEQMAEIIYALYFEDSKSDGSGVESFQKEFKTYMKVQNSMDSKAKEIRSILYQNPR